MKYMMFNLVETSGGILLKRREQRQIRKIRRLIEKFWLFPGCIFTLSAVFASKMRPMIKRDFDKVDSKLIAGNDIYSDSLLDETD
jgi:hypothetical protein